MFWKGFLSLAERVERLQPAAWVALFIWFWIGFIWVCLLPIGIAIASYSDTPLSNLARLVAAFGVGTLGGAVASLSYILVGRRLCSIPRIGPEVAGVVVLAPYMALLVFIVRLTDNLPPSADAEIIGAAVACAAIFGPYLGNRVLRDS